MKTPIAHNLKVAHLIEVLMDIPKSCLYVDAVVADELTLKFRPSKWQGENNDTPPEEPDINQLIV
jgi:hypothetical protein